MVYIRKTFAESGDKVAVPFDDPSDGSVSYETGYGAQYSQDPTSVATARRIERTKYNQILNTLSAEIQRYQQNAYPEFITSVDNGGSPFSYSKGATVRYLGSLYRSKINSNTNLPTDISSWYNVDFLRPVYSFKTADYTITDTDNIGVLGIQSGAAVVTASLPNVANNANRFVTVLKTDSGTGSAVIDGNGALIGTLSSLSLYRVGDSVTLFSTGALWLVVSRVGADDYALVDMTAGTSDFTAGSMVFYRSGNIVHATATEVLTHASAVSATAVGAIPVGFRPSNTLYNTQYYTESAAINVIFGSNGDVRVAFKNESGNVSVANCGGVPLTFSWAIT